MVRLAIRTWLGAGAPSAAATMDGAAICASDSTAQSAKKLRIRSPSPALKIAMTIRRSGLSSAARSAACTLPRSSWCRIARPRAAGRFAVTNASAVSSASSSTCTPGSDAIRTAWISDADGTRAATATPYLAVSSSAIRDASALAPQMMT